MRGLVAEPPGPGMASSLLLPAKTAIKERPLPRLPRRPRPHLSAYPSSDAGSGRGQPLQLQVVCKEGVASWVVQQADGAAKVQHRLVGAGLGAGQHERAVAAVQGQPRLKGGGVGREQEDVACGKGGWECQRGRSRMTDQPCAGCGFWGMPQTRGFKPGMGHNRATTACMKRWQGSGCRLQRRGTATSVR